MLIMLAGQNGLAIAASKSASYQLSAQVTNVSAAAGGSQSFSLRGLARHYYLRVPTSQSFILGEGFFRSVYFSQVIFAPIVTGISPNSGKSGEKITITDLSGANFLAG